MTLAGHHTVTLHPIKEEIVIKKEIVLMVECLTPAVSPQTLG